MSAEVSRAPAWALVVWSSPKRTWASICISERREVIADLHYRLRRFVPAIFSVLECASVFDDDVVAAAQSLRAPDTETVRAVEREHVGFDDPAFEMEGTE